MKMNPVDQAAKRRIWLWAVAWLALLAAAVALSVLAAGEDRLPGDLAVLRDVQSWRFPGRDLSRLVRHVTSTEVVLGTGAAVAVVLRIVGRRREALLLAAALVALPLLQHGLKEIVDRPRPPGDLVDLRAGYSSSSFPSGHVMSPTFLYAFLLWHSIRGPIGLLLRIAVGVFSTFVLLVTGLVNVYLGVHWPSDALGGYLWGVVLVLPIVAASEMAEGRGDSPGR